MSRVGLTSLALPQVTFLLLLRQTFLLHCLPLLHQREGLSQNPPFPLGVCLYGEVTLTTRVQDTARQLSDEIRSERDTITEKKKKKKKQARGHLLPWHERCVMAWPSQIIAVSAFLQWPDLSKVSLCVCVSGCGINVDYTLSHPDWITVHTTSDGTKAHEERNQRSSQRDTLIIRSLYCHSVVAEEKVKYRNIKSILLKVNVLSTNFRLNEAGLFNKICIVLSVKNW